MLVIYNEITRRVRIDNRELEDYISDNYDQSVEHSANYNGFSKNCNGDVIVGVMNHSLTETDKIIEADKYIEKFKSDIKRNIKSIDTKGAHARNKKKGEGSYNIHGWWLMC
jgi:hypothetical protein